MKNILILAIMLVTSLTGFSQTEKINNATDLIGTWQLKLVEIDGQTGTAEEVFGESETFQIYSKENVFESVVGAKKNKGSWELSEKGTKIIVETVDPKNKNVFNVKSFNTKKMTIAIKVQDDKLITLSYEKQNK